MATVCVYVFGASIVFAGVGVTRRRYIARTVLSLLMERRADAAHTDIRGEGAFPSLVGLFRGVSGQSAFA